LNAERRTLVSLLYQKGRDSRIFQAQDRAIDDFTLNTGSIRLCADVSRVRPVSTPLPTTSLAPFPQASRNSASTKAALALAGLALAVTLGGTGYGRYWWSVGRFIETTDDAYVGAELDSLRGQLQRHPKVALLASDIASREGCR
jgi:hypothetical protein